MPPKKGDGASTIPKESASEPCLSPITASDKQYPTSIPVRPGPHPRNSAAQPPLKRMRTRTDYLGPFFMTKRCSSTSCNKSKELSTPTSFFS